MRRHGRRDEVALRKFTAQLHQGNALFGIFHTLGNNLLLERCGQPHDRPQNGQVVLVNEHVMHTLMMLKTLPLPKNLQRVPDYAATHHETLTGGGYPRQLGEAELSIPMRILAIADVFEALTASDRPYKPAKTLSESIKILASFKRKRHIDPDLFDLFLTSGIYLQYAEKFLAPEQIDTVDIAAYLG